VLRSAACNGKTKPEQGATSETQKHRGGKASATHWWGTQLAWSSTEGSAVLSENGLLMTQEAFDDISDFYRVLKNKGPFVVRVTTLGQGHFILVYGVDKLKDLVYVSDPAWSLFKKTKKPSAGTLLTWMGRKKPGDQVVDDIVFVKGWPSTPSFCPTNAASITGPSSLRSIRYFAPAGAAFAGASSALFSASALP